MSGLRGSIHQPNFIPWLGYFAKILMSDVFILLDNVEYSKNSFINRNRIQVSDRAKWLTLPVTYKGSSKHLINEMTLSPLAYKSEKIIRTLDFNYASAPFYEEIVQPIKHELQVASRHRNLCTLNQAIIKYICEILNIKTIMRSASTSAVDADSASHMLSALCQANNIQTYLSGPSAKHYLHEEVFNKKNIICTPLIRSDLTIHDSELSIIHFLFNLGPLEVKKILLNFYRL